MPGCGFCKKAIEMFKDDIDRGKIIVKKHTESGNKFRGFPSFENTENGQHMSGLPTNKAYLFEKIGYVESNQHHVNQHQVNQHHVDKHHVDKHHVDKHHVDKHKSNGWSKTHFMMFMIGLLLIIFIILLISKYK